MLRISVTTIERFRQLLTSENMTEAGFIKDIKRLSPKTRAMELGTAFHDILENLRTRYDSKKKVFRSHNGIEFDYTMIAKNIFPLIDYRGILETKQTKIYEVKGAEVLIVAKADHLLGNWVTDFKSTWWKFSYDDYSESLQWRFYLDIFGADLFRYLVFVLHDTETGIEFVESHDFYFTAYPNMIFDIHDILEQFVEFIYSRNLQQYFLPKELQLTA